MFREGTPERRVCAWRTSASIKPRALWNTLFVDEEQYYRYLHAYLNVKNLFQSP